MVKAEKRRIKPAANALALKVFYLLRAPIAAAKIMMRMRIRRMLGCAVAHVWVIQRGWMANSRSFSLK
jgi:hypothetical protein